MVCIMLKNWINWLWWHCKTVIVDISVCWLQLLFRIVKKRLTNKGHLYLALNQGKFKKCQKKRTFVRFFQKWRWMERRTENCVRENPGCTVCAQITPPVSTYDAIMCVIIRLTPYLQGSITGQGAELAAAAQVVWYYLKLNLCMGPKEKKLCSWCHCETSHNDTEVSCSRALWQKQTAVNVNRDRTWRLQVIL